MNNKQFTQDVEKRLALLGDWTAYDAEEIICEIAQEDGFNGEQMVNEDGSAFGWIQDVPQDWNISQWATAGRDVWDQLRFNRI